MHTSALSYVFRPRISLIDKYTHIMLMLFVEINIVVQTKLQNHHQPPIFFMVFIALKSQSFSEYTLERSAQ